MAFEDSVELVGKIVDVVGVAVIVLGMVWAATRAPKAEAPQRYRRVRQDVGRAILLGLEILVAADIIRTVAVTPSLDSVAVLAVIVLIRTVLSFSLEVELEGRWPWQGQSRAASADPARS